LRSVQQATALIQSTIDREADADSSLVEHAKMPQSDKDTVLSLLRQYLLQQQRFSALWSLFEKEQPSFPIAR
jgi:uncharacterized protein HemY